MKLIFVHIPKTGGVSFAEAVRHVYGEEYNAYRVIGLRPEADTLLRADYSLRKSTWNAAMEKRLPPDANWLTDHVPVQLYDGLFPGVPRVTWLRDPVQRVVSAYIHDLTHGIVDPCGIYRYINMDEKQNLMTYFTAGGNLKLFAFVGLVERFNRDLARLAEMLGWADYPVSYANTTNELGLKKRLLSDPALVSEIKRLNQDDCELYKQAQEMKRYAYSAK